MTAGNQKSPLIGGTWMRSRCGENERSRGREAVEAVEAVGQQEQSAGGGWGAAGT